MISISGNNYNNIWADAIIKIMKHGEIRPSIGNSKKMIRHAAVSVEMGPEAIQQALDGKLHPSYPQQHGLNEYCNQFIEGNDDCMKSKGSQDYTYFGRTISQLKKIREMDLLKEEFNKRIQAVTWDKFEDLGAENPPCLQILGIVNIGYNECEINTLFRSHDFFGAWQFNNIALLRYLNTEVLEPAELTPVRFVEYNFSGHIYDYDWSSAKRVTQLPA